MSIPVLDLSFATSHNRGLLLDQLRNALYNVGFLYIENHGVPQPTISALTDLLPPLFDLPLESRAGLSKANSPHFLGYSGFAEETTLGKNDLREQFDYATELPVVWQEHGKQAGAGQKSRDFTKLYWRLRGPNQWPSERELPGFRKALVKLVLFCCRWSNWIGHQSLTALSYHDALAALSYRFVHLVEEAFNIPAHTFDAFFSAAEDDNGDRKSAFLPPQHRLKLLKYPAVRNDDPTSADAQGVGPHKDSSGWLTFLYQVGDEAGLEVLARDGTWLAAAPRAGTFVVNFGNAFEAATDGAVLATVHRVRAPRRRDRYSVPFFMGLPLDLTVSEIRSYIPEAVKRMRRDDEGEEAVQKTAVSSFLDPRWDSLGESQLRKWIRSHEDVARRWYGDSVTNYYINT